MPELIKSKYLMIELLGYGLGHNPTLPKDRYFLMKERIFSGRYVIKYQDKDITGRFHIEVYDENGEYVDRWDLKLDSLAESFHSIYLI